jgi:hypothetical protein
VIRRAIGVVGTAAAVVAMWAPTATARSGTWGVANVPYEAGVICSGGNITSPLVRWGFGDPNPDFLLQGVSSNGVVDSAQLPVAGTPNRISTGIQAGQYGFTSDTDIATYAALLDRDGGQHAAAVALALLEHSDPARVPSCVSPGAAAALVARARSQAGPYQISVSAARRPVILGTGNSVDVQVSGRSGAGAPGVRVSIDASAGVFAGSASTASAVTDASGRASVRFTAPDGISDQRVTFQAGASVSVGLEAVTVAAQFGQPGGYAPVAYADPPQAANARTSVPIDLTADPHIATSLPDRVVIAQQSVHLGVQVTGMRGHSGEAHITASGPTPLDQSSLCANVKDDAGATTGNPAYDSGDIDVRADQSANANTWTPIKPGCYLVRSHIETTNAVPKAQARGPARVVTVLDSASTLSTSSTIVGSGPLSAKLHLDRSYGLSGTARVRVLGPVRPPDNNCSTVDWSHVPTAASGTDPVHGDGDYAIRTSSVGDPGCYLFAGAVDLDVPNAGTARVPVDVAADSQFAYVLRPTLELTGDQTSTVSPHPVGTHIQVSGTFGQPGHLEVAMVHAPGGTFGCGRVDYSAGSRVGVGPAVAFTGDGTYAVASGPTTRNGCYSLVPTLVMDANKSITATGAAGAAGSTLVAGIDPGGTAGHAVPHGGGSSPFGSDVLTSVLVYVGLAIVATGLMLRLIIADGESRSGPSPGFDTMLRESAPGLRRRFRLARALRGEDRG